MLSSLLFGSAFFIAGNTSLQASFQELPKPLLHVRNIPKMPFVKVLLLKGQKSLHVEINGAHNIYDPKTGEKLESAFLKSEYHMSVTNDGLKWGEEFPGIFQLLLIPDSKQTYIVLNGIQYPGAVAFYEVEGAISAVNWVGIEDFTTALLSMKLMPRDYDQKEALAAYAIAFRTIAYNAILQSQNMFWDITAADASYKGRAVTRSDALFVDAVHRSHDIVLQDSELLKPSQTISDAMTTLLQTMPYDEVKKFAEAGQNARHILDHFYPGQALTVVDVPKETSAAVYPSKGS